MQGQQESMLFSLIAHVCICLLFGPVKGSPLMTVTMCDFDESMCGFVQDQNDVFDWRRHKGSTVSVNTGPTADHTGTGGYYMYIETSSPRVLGDTAKLNSPLLTFSGNMCLRFFYHMYGSTIGRLNVTINGQTVFSASGNKGNRWLEARINSSFSGNYTVTFEGIRGSSFTGDIAIDDFSLTSGTCLPPISCDFDKSLCGFVQDKNDTFDWTRRKGSTSSSSTGPIADHSGNGGYYMYIETSSPRVRGDNAKLNSPLLTFSGNMCLIFFYHMYGLTMGRLNVIINGTKTVFSASGNKGNRWLEARINSSFSGNYMVTFEGITGSSFTGDIAIDDFSLNSGICHPLISCDFDESMCGFVQDKNDRFDWTRRNGSTPSSSTGPSADHTGNGGYYMYIESSWPRVLGDNAKLNSPLLRFSGKMCLIFFYHMYGSTIGKLDVLINGTKTVFSASGNKGSNWFEARITTSLTGIYMITFEGIRGISSTGDIAIDDFSLIAGSCPGSNVTCNFDTSMCGFVQDKNDKFDWIRRTGSTPSYNTGPSADHTGSFFGYSRYYMYIETSSPRLPFDNAKLNSPLLQFSGNMCLKFFYHMYGSTIGRLNVIVSGFKTVFSSSGNKGDQWLGARITISLSGMYMITFEGIRGYSNTGDIAIDDFSLSTGPCSPIFDPCKNYKVLNTPDRLVGFSGLNPARCDQRDLSAGWYRFTGAAGDRMPTTCPKMRHCGTYAPGWMKGRHPTVAEGVVTRDVCYHWTSGCCQWTNNIQVKNCGAFYVYELQKTPVCFLRYCGEASECVYYRALNQSDRSMSNSDQSNVKCDGGESELIVSPAWYRMTGDSGNQIPENCVPVKRCGTSAPGWLNGTHPTVEEGVLTQTICYHWSGKCCNWKNTINIRNCSDYYVYQLAEPPACPLRYCGNKQETPTTLPPATTLAPARQCRVQCRNGKKCRKFGKFLCLCERGKKGINCQEEDVLKEVLYFSLAIKSEDWKLEYLNMNNPTTKELVDRIKKTFKANFGTCCSGVGSVSEEIGIGKVIIKSLRKGSVIADVQLKFNESVGESEVDLLLKETTKDGQFGQFNVDEAVVQFTPIPVKLEFSSSDPTEPGKINKAFIYGPLIGVLLLVLLLFGIYRVLILKRRNAQKNEEDTRRDVREACGDSCQNRQVEIQMTSGVNNVGYEQGPLQITRSTTKSFGVEEGTADDGTSDYLELDKNAMLEPADEEWEIPRESVTVEKIIGKGAFGQVAQGTVFSLHGGKETTTVAIKMLKNDALESERKDLLSELEVMKTLKPHPHVIKLLGCVTASDPLLVVIEYVPYGDLLGYLRKSRGLNDNYFNDLDVKPQTSLTSQQLMKIAWQIADGMSYLSSRNIIHRDLAARNVLVGEQEICKVTDFGMARDVEQENIYQKKSKGVVPVKWTAHEGLFYGVYTTKSDVLEEILAFYGLPKRMANMYIVWSYGVVLYEIFTIGGAPYPRTPPRRMAELLQRGYRMPKPNHVDEALYRIMLKCWQENPDDRPTFENLRDELNSMENQHKKLINMQEYEEHLYDYFEDFLV